jgi:hypothetical protein
VLGVVVVASGAAISIVATHHSSNHASTSDVAPVAHLRW